jgi:hypothetical protein
MEMKNDEQHGEHTDTQGVCVLWEEGYVVRYRTQPAVLRTDLKQRPNVQGTKGPVIHSEIGHCDILKRGSINTQYE